MKKDEKWISFSKIIWIFLIGAVAGYIIETSFYYIKHDEFLSKQGLLYGPIKPIYGIGAVIYTLMLYVMKNKKNWQIFLYGCIVGGVFEYICSLVLEYCFGTRMWTYKNMGLDINGRVYLPYLIGWGAIALLYLKLLYPTFNKLYDKIPKKPLRILTIILTIFLVYDVTISSLAVKRMTARKDGVKATTKYQKYMDKHYSDEYILKKVPYLKFAD